jgi:hypothetical protein
MFSIKIRATAWLIHDMNQHMPIVIGFARVGRMEIEKFLVDSWRW